MAESDHRPSKVTEIRLNLDDCLSRVRYRIDIGRPHIQIDESACRDCDHRTCISVCPAEVYEWNERGMSVRWERCLECGACRLTCDHATLSWKFPRGGCGVTFRIG